MTIQEIVQEFALAEDGATYHHIDNKEYSDYAELIRLHGELCMHAAQSAGGACVYVPLDGR